MYFSTLRRGAVLATGVAILALCTVAGLLGADGLAAESCGHSEDEERTSHRAIRWADFQGAPDQQYTGMHSLTTPLAHIATTARVDRGAVVVEERAPSERIARAAGLQAVGSSRAEARAGLLSLAGTTHGETMGAYRALHRTYDRETRDRTQRIAQARWTAEVRAQLSPAGNRNAAEPACVHVESPYWFIGWSLPSAPIPPCE